MEKIKLVKRFLVLMISVSMIFAGCSKRVDDASSTPGDTVASDTMEESSSGETSEEYSSAENSEETSGAGESEESSSAENSEETSGAGESEESSSAENSEETSSAGEPEEPSSAETTEEPSSAESSEVPSNAETPAEPSTEAPHVHEWSAWKTETEATCTQNGVRTRSCVCGDTETESISATGHSYSNGVCSCGVREYAGIFNVVENIQLTNCYWSNGSIITGRNTEGGFMYDSSGKVLAGPYDGMLCPNPAGYVVAYNEKSEVLSSKYDENFGMTITTTRDTTSSYLLDPSGKVVFQTECISVDSFDSVTYEGELLMYCNEDRIVTITYNTYWMGMAFCDGTLHIYDMSGNKLADIPEVIGFGNMIDGKMVLFRYQSVLVIDKNGQELAVLDDLYDRYDTFIEFQSIAAGHHTAFFANGYVGINCYNNMRLLVSEDAATTYLLNSSYLCGELNYGTLVFSKVISNGTVSDAYYLLDVSRCQVDSDGVVIPGENAVVCNTPVTYGNFESFFGDEEKYALISTADGKWGYLSYDGQMLKLYDDASAFAGGYAAVKDGAEFYIIDENFNRVSNSLSGYESVSTCGKGVFWLKNGDRYVVAVFEK